MFIRREEYVGGPIFLRQNLKIFDVAVDRVPLDVITIG